MHSLHDPAPLTGAIAPGYLAFDLLARLLLATALGGAVGWERERNGKPAGLRTNILICVGAALLTEVSIAIGEHASFPVQADPGRISAQIVSGIGFLGAGTIIQARGSVTGLTTAATLWVVAAIGISVGAHAYLEAVGATLLVLIVLIPLGIIERRVAETRTARSVLFRLRDEPQIMDRVQGILEEGGMEVTLRKAHWKAEEKAVEVVFSVAGPERAFRRLRPRLTRMSEVLGFEVDRE